MAEMKSFTVGLGIPTYVWANVDVEAPNADEAQKIALAKARAGELEFENATWDTDEVEIHFTNETVAPK